MKKIILSLAVSSLLFTFSCKEEEKKEDIEVTTDLIEKITSIEFENELYEFGKITQGEKVEHSFTFKNTGEYPLIIGTARGSCGCTIPQWPTEPIAPGEKGKIDVVFDSNGKEGFKHVTVTISANTEPNVSVVALKGEILVPETK
jgi:hypothetical protein